MSTAQSESPSIAIKVLFFASLRERVGQGELSLGFDAPLTAAEVWTRVTGDESPPKNLLAAINLEYVPLTARVNDGDELAFFPPVTGG